MSPFGPCGSPGHLRRTTGKELQHKLQGNSSERRHFPDVWVGLPVGSGKHFAPALKFVSPRAILAIAAEYDLEVHQMDVKSLDLNSELNEKMFMGTTRRQGVAKGPGRQPHRAGRGGQTTQATEANDGQAMRWQAAARGGPDNSGAWCGAVDHTVAAARASIIQMRARESMSHRPILQPRGHVPVYLSRESGCTAATSFCPPIVLFYPWLH
jgi:hypothetical protein